MPEKPRQTEFSDEQLGHFRGVYRALEASEKRERSALEDPVTGLLSRAAFEQRLVDVEPIAHRFGGHVLWIDMADLKGINDEYSNDTGDEALRTFAQAMQKAFRDYEMPYRETDESPFRTGGDEFGAILVDGDPGKLIERFKKELRKPEYLVKEQSLDFYYGIAELKEDESLVETRKRAQAAQAQAKRAKKLGRDKASPTKSSPRARTL